MVVVIADNINEANMLATALYHMDIERGKEFIKKYDAEGYWYNNKEIYMTKGFKKYLKGDI